MRQSSGANAGSYRSVGLIGLLISAFETGRG